MYIKIIFFILFSSSILCANENDTLLIVLKHKGFNEKGVRLIEAIPTKLCTELRFNFNKECKVVYAVDAGTQYSVTIEAVPKNSNYQIYISLFENGTVVYREQVYVYFQNLMEQFSRLLPHKIITRTKFSSKELKQLANSRSILNNIQFFSSFGHFIDFNDKYTRKFYRQNILTESTTDDYTTTTYDTTFVNESSANSTFNIGIGWTSETSRIHFGLTWPLTTAFQPYFGFRHYLSIASVPTFWGLDGGYTIIFDDNIETVGFFSNSEDMGNQKANNGYTITPSLGINVIQLNSIRLFIETGFPVVIIDKDAVYAAYVNLGISVGGSN